MVSRKIKCIVILLLFSTILYANIITDIQLLKNYKGYKKHASFSYFDIGLLKRYTDENKGTVYNYLIKEVSDEKICIERRDQNSEKCYYEIIIDNSSIEFINGDIVDKFKYRNTNDCVSIEGDKYQITYSNNDFYFKTQSAEYYYKNSILYDKKTYGRFFTSKNIRNLYRITGVSPDSVVLTGFCPYDNSLTNCFSYNAENTYLYKIESRDIPLLFRFINYYMSMGEDQYNFEMIFPIFISNYKISEEENRTLSIEASSFLIEGDRKYQAENLLSLDGLPWVSGNGFGINDKIMMYIESEGDLKLSLYNGFQSLEKPYLYSLNSRVKKIKITDIDTKNSKQIYLDDTKEKQIIEIKDIIVESKRTVRLEIEILEVFKGSKYSDLCIQAIIAE